MRRIEDVDEMFLTSCEGTAKAAWDTLLYYREVATKTEIVEAITLIGVLTNLLRLAKWRLDHPVGEAADGSPPPGEG